MFIDSHCHLLKEYYDDLEEVLKLAKNNYVTRFINNATSKEFSLHLLSHLLYLEQI